MRTKIINIGFAAAAMAAFFAVQPAMAHHSGEMFDMTKSIKLTGTIKDFQWTNPHTWTWIDVPNDKGGTDTWGIEGMSPNFLGRRGWTKHTLQPGDKVTITIAPLKNGQNGGTFLRAILADGREMVMFERPPTQTSAR
ncbi:MAG: hypothetical protein JOZ32_21475 [Bryobacterales bacterium]|nr:hypothetical protein [Bryobacterales bacterium]